MEDETKSLKEFGEKAYLAFARAGRGANDCRIMALDAVNFAQDLSRKLTESETARRDERGREEEARDEEARKEESRRFVEDGDPGDHPTGELLVSMAVCPDGTIIRSLSPHHFCQHIDNWGRVSYIDGGTDYFRLGGDSPPYPCGIYSDDDFQIIRRFFGRFHIGEDGDQTHRYVTLRNINDAWLRAIIDYNVEKGIDGPAAQQYVRELEYRREQAAKARS